MQNLLTPTSIVKTNRRTLSLIKSSTVSAKHVTLEINNNTSKK